MYVYTILESEKVIGRWKEEENSTIFLCLERSRYYNDQSSCGWSPNTNNGKKQPVACRGFRSWVPGYAQTVHESSDGNNLLRRERDKQLERKLCIREQKKWRFSKQSLLRHPSKCFRDVEARAIDSLISIRYDQRWPYRRDDQKNIAPRKPHWWSERRE